MNIDFIKNTQDGKCVVMGCGPSVLNLQPYLDQCFTIGVNDIGDFCDPDMLVIVDEPYAFTPTRLETIIGTRPKMLVSHTQYWNTHITAPHNFFHLEFGSRGTDKFDDDISMNKIPIANTSTYIGVALAYYMGFRTIGMIGVDFTRDHYNNADGVHKLNRHIRNVNDSYIHIHNKLTEKGIEFWNLSKESIIDVPKMDLKEFFT